MGLIMGQGGAVICTGRLIKDAERRPNDKYNITKLVISTGKDEPAVTATLWNDMALGYASLKKHDHVLVGGTLQTHEYNGKTYREINVDYIQVMTPVNLTEAPASDPFSNLTADDVPF